MWLDKYFKSNYITVEFFWAKGLKKDQNEIDSHKVTIRVPLSLDDCKCFKSLGIK